MSDNFEEFCDKEEGYATELEWLRWFAKEADFGPADSDVHYILENKFEKQTGKKVPKEWSWKHER